MKLIMFDIDGTLVRSSGHDVTFFLQAVKDVLGVSVSADWRDYQHITHGGVARQILRRSVPPKAHDYFYNSIRQGFTERVRAHLQQNPRAMPALPGARRFLNELRARPDVVLAIATGGWAESARLKLAAAGLDCSGIHFASSSDTEDRPGIMRIAERRALGGREVRRKIYFGDGAWDREACQHLSYDFVAIGNQVVHPVAFRDFSEPQRILQRLGLK